MSEVEKNIPGGEDRKIKKKNVEIRTYMTNLDSVLKSRDITWPRKFCLVKAYGFSSSHVWM